MDGEAVATEVRTASAVTEAVLTVLSDRPGSTQLLVVSTDKRNWRVGPSWGVPQDGPQYHTDTSPVL